MKKITEKPFTLPATLMGVGTCNDGSLSIRFRTQELTSEAKLVVLEFQNTFGNLLFSANEIQEKDIPSFKPVEKHDKTPSKRLRNVLYRVHEQTDTMEDFDTFYKRKMEQIIEHFKGKLT